MNLIDMKARLNQYHTGVAGEGKYGVHLTFEVTQRRDILLVDRG